MRVKKSVIGVLLIIAFLVTGCGIEKQNSDKYPTKPITWVIPYGPGGGSDQFARNLIVAVKEVEPSINIVPLNMPGAMTATALNYVMQQPVDGYTIFGGTQDVVMSMIQGNTKHTLADLQPIMRNQHNLDMLMIKKAEKRFQNIKELIAYAKSHQGQVTVATTGLKGTDALSIHTLEKAFNIQFKIVPYDKPAERYAALLGGNVDVLYEQPGDVKGFLDNGDFLPVIAMIDKKVPGFEQVPTTKDLGIDLTLGFWRGVFVKKGTPPDAVTYLERVLKKAMETETYKNYEKNQYLDIRPGMLDKDSFEKYLQEEINYLKTNSSQI